MRLVLNLLWLLLGGVWLFVAYLVAGVVVSLTIVGIPFGVQSFKLAAFALWPFGRSMVARPDASVSLSLVGNVVWILFAGIWLALTHLVVGAVLCATIVGIPLGLGSIKMIPLAFAPFGRDVVRPSSLVVAPRSRSEVHRRARRAGPASVGTRHRPRSFSRRKTQERRPAVRQELATRNRPRSLSGDTGVL